MDYKVVILAAGTGSRMEGFSEHLNKVLIPVQGKPTICHIIEYFSEDVEIVIAVGYKKDSLIKYLETAYPNRKLTFVNVYPYQGEGSGPGYSLYSCKDKLQCPFIHIAGDTLIKEKIPKPDSNWIGISKVKDTSRFCSVRIEGENVIGLDDKIKTENEYAYIGLLGIYNYSDFWKGLEDNKRVVEGEIQVSNGINSLLRKNLKPKKFTWFDTGTPESYKHSLENYPDGKSYLG